jgi:hypothetical protein
VKKLLLLSSMLMAFAGVVRADEDTAGLFVEPMLTWERGRGDLDLPSPLTTAKTELDGFGVGARLGMHVFESFFIAADGRYSLPTFKEDRFGSDADAKAWNVGPTIGMQMPTTFGLRLWAGWIVASEVDPDPSQGLDVKFKSGQGFRVGAGVKLSVVSLNIEYQKINYSTTELENAGPLSGTSNFELDNDSMLLSVSFPIAI